MRWGPPPWGTVPQRIDPILKNPNLARGHVGGSERMADGPLLSGGLTASARPTQAAAPGTPNSKWLAS